MTVYIYIYIAVTCAAALISSAQTTKSVVQLVLISPSDFHVIGNCLLLEVVITSQVPSVFQ